MTLATKSSWREVRLMIGLLVAVSCILTSWGQPAMAQSGNLPQVGVPKILSPSCVVMDAVSGTVLYEKNAHEKRPPASTTKIMTLVLALEDVASGKVHLNDEVTASENAADMGGTEVWAEPGESMPLEEWIKAVAVASANDAAVVLAEYLAGSEEAFVARMNQRAKELGMTGTNFVNPHGLDAEGHVTTAMDLAILSRHAVKVPHLLEYTRIYQQPFRGGKNLLTNFNKLVYLYPGCDGLKTGMTSKAGYCLAATASRGTSRFIVVIMGAETPEQRQEEAWKLLDWAFANFRSLEIVRAGERLGQVRVLKGKSETVNTVPKYSFGVTLTRGQKGEVRKVLRIDKVVAPVGPGQVVGKVELEVDGEKVGEVPLVAEVGVEKASFLDYAVRYIRAFTIGR